MEGIIARVASVGAIKSSLAPTESQPRIRASAPDLRAERSRAGPRLRQLLAGSPQDRNAVRLHDRQCLYSLESKR